MTAVQWPFLRRIGFRFHLEWHLRDPAIIKMATLSAYTTGYVVTNQLGYAVIPILAAGVQGGYTAYVTAFTFFQLPHGIFAVSVMTALLPPMSEQAVARDWDAFRASLARGLRLTAVVLLPASIGYLTLAEPIVRLLLAHGVVTAASVELLTDVLTMFVIGLLPFSVFQFTLRAFYALQDTRTTFRVNLVSTGLNVVLNLLLFALLPQPWKVPGLALGFSSAYAVGAVLLLVRLSARIGGIGARRILGAFGRMLLAGAAMGVVLVLLARGAPQLVGSGTVGSLVTVAAGVGAGLATYLGMARLLRVEELGTLLAIVRRRR
ncbi:MAG: polysaccharide biosynthesis C-terminal domain-containing protein [Sporichthyaceae bacterium]|nr:polysaccharide biosynthesis C-terminal domain-containing protein [Sporichthyaceae bacterium]